MQVVSWTTWSSHRVADPGATAARHDEQGYAFESVNITTDEMLDCGRRIEYSQPPGSEDADPRGARSSSAGATTGLGFKRPGR
jgi:hypothetical protein